MSSHLPPSLISNLQNVLIARKEEQEEEKSEAQTTEDEENCGSNTSSKKKPIVLITNCDGISSPGLRFLVDALLRDAQYDIHVCVPDSDKSVSGHSVTLHETITVSSAEMNGATAFEVSGTPVDCVSLALSGALFSWSQPALVVSGVNKVPSCGNHILYSGAIAGAREALMCGVPSLSVSLNWRKDESKESEFKDAVDVCLPIIHAAIQDAVKGLFPKSCLLHIEIPPTPSSHKGFKVTRQSAWRPALNWQAVSANRNPAAGPYMSMHQSLGVQLAQLGRDASAAAAARRVAAQKKNVEVESVAASGKPETQRGVVKKFRMEFGEKEYEEDLDDDCHLRAVEEGFVAVTPLHFHVNADSEIQASTSNWLASVLAQQEEEA